MKKRKSQTNPKNPSPLRFSFPTGSRSSGDQSKADEPKTSEYAFFKKLKTDAGQRSHSHPLQNEETQSIEFRSSECPRRSSSIRNSSKDFRFPTEDAAHGLFLTPLAEVDSKRASTAFGDICTTRENVEEYSRTSRPEGTQYQHENLFSTKRQKLHQWVKDVSFPNIEELCSKGCDYVSVLVSRLFPESNKDNSFNIPKFAQVESDTKAKLLASPFSDSHLQEFHQMSSRNFMEVECGSYLENGSSPHWLDRSRERNLPNSASLSSYGHNDLIQYNLRDHTCEIGGQSNTISWNESDSAFSFPFKSYGRIPSTHLRELDDSHYPDDSLLRRKQNVLLLGWDANERTSSVISHSKELIKYQLPLTSWDDKHEQSLYDGFEPLGASGFGASSVMCKYPPNFYSLAPSHPKDDFERHFLEDNKCIADDLNHYPSTLSHMPSYLSLIEDRNHDTMCNDSTAFPFPGNHHCIMSKPDFERHLLPDREDTTADLNHYPLTLSHSPSYLTLIEDCNHDTTCNRSTAFPSHGNLQCLMSKPDFERHLLEDREDKSADMGDYSLTLSHRPSYLSMIEDCNHDIICNGSTTFPSPGNHHCHMSKPDFRRHLIEDKEDITTTLSHVPSTSYLSLTEGDCKVSSEGSRSFLSPENHNLFKSNVSGERHHAPGTEPLLSSELDFDLVRECLALSDPSSKHCSSVHSAIQFPQKEGILSPFLINDKYENCMDGVSHRGILSHFCEDMVNIHDGSSFYFQISLDKQKASCPLLLDKSSWDGSEEEIYCGDTYNRCFPVVEH